MRPHLRLPLRRSTRNRLLRASLLALLIFTLHDLLSLHHTRASIPIPSSPHPRPTYTGPPIFLASTHWNNAAILSSNWTSSILALAQYLGPSYLFVSIVESGSWDDSGAILRDLETRLGELGVGNVVKTGGRTHKEEMSERPVGEGWVETGRVGKGAGAWELRRVPYLAGIRNEVLEVLWQGVEGVRRAERQREGVEKGGKVVEKREDKVERRSNEPQGKKGKVEIKRRPTEKIPALDSHTAKGVDKPGTNKDGGWDWANVGYVVWVNDVVFTVDDILNLINTRDGEYAAACSMDYSKPPAYYDTFALRDIEGHEAVTSTFPYFRSSISRQAMIAGEPVPVQSCWNGMVSFDAQPFTSPFPLSFRGTSDTLAAHHLEASECCLIHNDNYLTTSKGIYINPSVRVGYNPSAYDQVHNSSPWPALGEAWRGVWWNRLARWGTTEWFKQRRVKRRVERWRREGEVVGGETRYETGEGCLINEMQVLVENGWAHV